MGLFDKFLEKKECGICGKELGLLGKTKLQDGYVCKDCARASPTSILTTPPRSRLYQKHKRRDGSIYGTSVPIS